VTQWLLVIEGALLIWFLQKLVRAVYELYAALITISAVIAVLVKAK
jgi:hypothetical protein